MRVLLIKTSSMGDIIHTLPALSDAGNAIPSIQFDWVIEQDFAEIPTWHDKVNQVIPVFLRRWRKKIFSPTTLREWKQLISTLQPTTYDLILDAQGLMKSAFLSFFVKGNRVGLDWSSARESFASLFYQQKYKVNFYQHAVIRMRQLFSQALQYPLPLDPPQFGLDRSSFSGGNDQGERYFVFLHGTTWGSKQWPEDYWIELAKLITSAGYHIKISGGNQSEYERAWRIADEMEGVKVYKRLEIHQMARLLADAEGAVAVDTGFGHLSAALGVPTVSLYSSTDPHFTGALGQNSIHLTPFFPCAPCLKRKCNFNGPRLVNPACFAQLNPKIVWERLQRLVPSPY